MKLMDNALRRFLPVCLALFLGVLAVPLAVAPVAAQQPALTPISTTAAVQASAQQAPGGEANLKIPDLTNTTVPVTFFGWSGHSLLMVGIVVCVLGLLF